MRVSVSRFGGVLTYIVQQVWSIASTLSVCAGGRFVPCACVDPNMSVASSRIDSVRIGMSLPGSGELVPSTRLWVRRPPSRYRAMRLPPTAHSQIKRRISKGKARSLLLDCEALLLLVEWSPSRMLGERGRNDDSGVKGWHWCPQ